MSSLAPQWDAHYVTGGGERSLADLIAHRSTELGHKVYLAHAREDRSLSFAGLASAVASRLAAFDAHDVAIDATVGLVVADPVSFAATFLAAIASGRWAAPFDPGTPPSGLGAAMARVQVDIVFSDQPDPGLEGPRWVDLREGAPVDAGTGGTEVMSIPTIGTLGGAVLASSGTTGPPKVVHLRQDQLLHTARQVAEHHGFTGADKGFNSLPLFHINAEVVGLLSTLVAGSTLVLDDGFHRTDFWAVMARHRITWINAVPAIVARLAELRPGESVPSGIRFIRSASAPLPAGTMTQFEATTGIPVLETYGMTEAASQITANPIDGPRKPGSVGLPVGVELRLVPDGEPAPGLKEQSSGTIGHVEIRGPSVIRAYGGNHHRDRFDAHGWLRTGDLGHLDEDGYLYLDARSDDVINRGGEKVFPREIEELVLGDPQVAGASVVGEPDPELGQVPVAFLVVPELQYGLSDVARVVDRVRRHLDVALVRTKRPVAYYVVEELPAGATGKVQRRALRQNDIPVRYHLNCR